MSYLNKKTIFIAGGTGCAGGSIIQYILDRYPQTKIRATRYKHTDVFLEDPRLEYVYAELKSSEDCRKAVKGCDCAVMVAANTAGANVIAASPSSFVTDNTIINAQLLEAFHLGGVKRVIYVSSASLYQEYNGHIKEDELDLNIEPHEAFFGYGWVARFVEKLCKYWHIKHGMEMCILRGANIYGPFDKFNPNKSHFIPALVRKAVDKMDPFEVWGSPDVTRDVLYVSDFASAVVEMMNSDKFCFDTYNLCTGKQVRVGDVVEMALKAAGHESAKIEYLSSGPTTINFRAFDNEKLKAFLGWEPLVDAEEGIRLTTEWWKENRDVWTK